MPSCTLHDDIERRSSSRAHQSRAQFLTAAPPSVKKKSSRNSGLLEFLLQRYALSPRQSIVHKCTIIMRLEAQLWLERQR